MMEVKVKQSVIREIEGQIIKPDADSKVSMITLDQEQTYIDSVMKVDTFRGGTEFNLFNLSTMEVQFSNNKTMNYVWRKDSEANSERWSDVSRRHEG